MKHRILALLLILAVYLPLLAQNTFTAYPYLAYSGETNLMVGAFSFFRHELDTPSPFQRGRDVSVLGNTIYSLNNQFLFVVIPQYRTENWKLAWSLIFQDWPDTFYGIGNFTDADAAEDFTSRRYAIETQISRDLGRNLDLSLRTTQGWHDVRKSMAGGLMQSTAPLGFDPSFYSGIGYGISYDSTDESYYPEQGLKLELRQLFFDDVLGSDFDYTESQYDLRAYIKSSAKSVLALQSDLITHNGDMPFYNYPELGNRLRAYDSKRFIDKLRISQRVENRLFPFDGNFSRRIGFVLFAETGQVAPSIHDLNFKDWHYSLGGGLRFSILPDEKLNLRADIGFGDDSMNFMINAREVF